MTRKKDPSFTLSTSAYFTTPMWSQAFQDIDTDALQAAVIPKNEEVNCEIRSIGSHKTVQERMVRHLYQHVQSGARKDPSGEQPGILQSEVQSLIT